MKVSDINQQANSMQYVNQANSQNSSDKTEQSKEAEGKSPSMDKVELSVQSKEMKKIYDTLQLTPDVRAEKVSSLKKSIQENQYQVDSEVLADKMIKGSLLDLVK